MVESVVKQSLESLRAKGIPAADESLPEVRPGGGDVWVLSAAQQRMWFLEQLEPGNASQHLLQAWRVRGSIEPGLLQRAVDALFWRHEALRLVILPGAAGPQQRLGEARSLVLTSSDLSAAAHPREALAELVRQDAREPFQMERGPLLRLRLARLAPDEHALVLTIHHILSDGAWTGEVFLQELASLYDQLVKGEAPQLPPLPVQYGDYVNWAERHVMPGPAEEDAWRRRLAGVPSVLELPADAPRPPRQTFRAGRVDVTVPPSLQQTLEALAAREGVTLFSLLLTAFTTLLHRHSRQEELVVGWPAPLRFRPELQGLIGYFGNPVALRSRLEPRTRGLDAARRMDQEVREANALATLPFERLVTLLGVERDPSRHPLYQVMFELLPAQPTRRAGGCTFSPLDVFSGLVAYDATLLLEPRDGGLVGALDFNADLFGRARMERLGAQYLHLLEYLAAEPQAPLSGLPLLSPQEERTLLEETALGPAVEGSQVAALERFEQQVRRTPHAPALGFGPKVLSYDALNRQANQLAHALRRMGVGPDTLVALCVERSLELPMALLAIWKAGGGFLPLDVNNPRERLAFLLADAGVRVVLTQEHLLSRLPVTDAAVLCVDRDAERIAREPEENPAHGAGLDHLAYVIHTSGSTGTPKGIAMMHRCLANLVAWQLTHPRLGGVSRTLQFASLNFDICYQELFTTWAVGGTVLMVTEEVRRDAARLLDVLEQEQVSRLYLPFIALQQLARVADERGAAPRSLRQLITAGEQLQATPELQRLLARMPECSLHNQYGPSECHVVTSHDLAREPSAWPRLPPIGRPLGNLRLLLLDGSGRPVPQGVPGEVFLGGPALARGYLGRPAQTAERFVPHPFEPGARLYRTGDLARLREDGELEFLQRVDAQVKIRGYRIEPGEIEVALSEHPAVEQAHVRPYLDSTGERRLVAYVAARLDAPAAEVTEAEHVGRWRSVWDETYRSSARAEGTFDLAGWNDSVRGEPLSPEEMREWVESTVARVRALEPRRVLEIGCGSGLLLHRLAPECELYWGTDLSDVTIRRLEEQLRAGPPALAQRVRLETRPAEDFSGLSEAAFDTVVLNSVTQLFPSVDYLLRVIQGALRLLRPGGSLFVGDVQNLRLFELFHFSVVLAQSPAELDAAPLLGRVHQRMLLDERLYVDPAFFPALVGQVPSLGAVDVRLKRGSGGNEMNCFRYDVVLRRSPVAEAPASEVPTLEWERDGLSLERVRRMLEERPSGLLLRQVPNARTAEDAARLALLRYRGSPLTVGRLMALPAVASCEPEALCRLAESLGYGCQLDWSPEAEDGRFDALLHLGWVRWTHPPRPTRPWRDYANPPLLASQRRELLGGLRAQLERTLPEYMVPSSFVLLPELPRKPTGKLDVAALPLPEPTQAEHAASHLAPRTPTERKLAELWRRVLGVQRVGAHDDFFQLGGHSLLATRLLSLIRSELGLELPLRVLFEQSTLATMAGCMDARGWSTQQPSSAQATEEGEI
ncbi:amino acid adenylation domain-containing protein [Vitiosangium sp. GDMCC 1.1324]|uniref:non-ribosomal peptide synthetase n=1 Tax=Vitiosangium sp. (strain GDMCC 1.1324) TaxID=2138576 RepID=UPI0021009565|nr:amino acid adenylation domain-containing protein [Vitiosangium sp. GDMCC 1.1324]